MQATLNVDVKPDYERSARQRSLRKFVPQADQHRRDGDSPGHYGGPNGGPLDRAVSRMRLRSCVGRSFRSALA